MGKIFAVGIGPGDERYMTDAAVKAIEASDVLCGYTAYIDLVKDRYPDKQMYSTPMPKEKERCVWAVERAREGMTVSVVCSGDAGVYGMAGLLLEIMGTDTTIDFEVVPGITAALSGAALLGAPLMNDFCVISLSDLLTPWDMIEKRIRAAAQSDFAVVLYNPASHKRTDHLRRACDIFLTYRDPGNACGWVRNIGRENEEKGVLTLKGLRDYEADMFTTVFIASSAADIVGGRIVTKRGYSIK